MRTLALVLELRDLGPQFVDALVDPPPVGLAGRLSRLGELTLQTRELSLRRLCLCQPRVKLIHVALGGRGRDTCGCELRGELVITLSPRPLARSKPVSLRVELTSTRVDSRLGVRESPLGIGPLFPVGGQALVVFPLALIELPLPVRNALLRVIELVLGISEPPVALVALSLVLLDLLVERHLGLSLEIGLTRTGEVARARLHAPFDLTDLLLVGV